MPFAVVRHLIMNKFLCYIVGLLLEGTAEASRRVNFEGIREKLVKV